MKQESATSAEESNNPFLNILHTVLESFEKMGQDFASFFPNLVIAIIFVCLGVVLAKLIRGTLTKILESIKIDTLLESSGIQPTLAKMGIKGSLAVTIPKAVGYFIIVFMIKAAADSAGFNDIANFLASIFAFAPKLITAFLIMVVGMFVGDIIQNTVYNTLDAKGLDYATSLSRIVFGLVFIVFLTVSLSQVGIETELLKDSVKILLLGVATALALALGLGLRNHASNIVAAVYVRDIYRQGTTLEIDGDELTIRGVGPVTTKLQKDSGEFVILPNSDLVSTKIKGRSTPLG